MLQQLCQETAFDKDMTIKETQPILHVLKNTVGLQWVQSFLQCFMAEMSHFCRKALTKKEVNTHL